jgi:hypothetical protein
VRPTFTSIHLRIESWKLFPSIDKCADGKGIVSASSDGLDTGFGDLYYAALHLGATAWYLLAAHVTNPFTL